MTKKNTEQPIEVGTAKVEEILGTESSENIISNEKKKGNLLTRIENLGTIMIACGCSSMAELQLPKLITRVRFPSSAP